MSHAPVASVTDEFVPYWEHTSSSRCGKPSPQCNKLCWRRSRLLPFGAVSGPMSRNKSVCLRFVEPAHCLNAHIGKTPTPGSRICPNKLDRPPVREKSVSTSEIARRTLTDTSARVGKRSAGLYANVRLSPGSAELIRPELAVVSKRLQLCCKTPGDTRNSVLDLRDAPLLRGLTALEQAHVASVAKPLEYGRRELIFAEDRPVEAIYLVVSGRVKTSQVNGCGKEIIFAVHKAGDVIDGFGWFPGRTHSISARAVDNCRVVAFDVNQFDRIAEKIPALRRNTVAVLTERIRILQTRFLDMATEKVPQRLAKLLIEFVQQDLDGESIDLSCEELAQMAGTTVWTVSRLLCSWAERGIIEPESKFVVLENFEALLEIANGA